MTPNKIIRTVQAHVNETVEIQWINDQSEILHERHAAPPEETWKVRLA